MTGFCIFMQLPAAPKSQPACIFECPKDASLHLAHQSLSCCMFKIACMYEAGTTIVHHCEASTVMHRWHSLSPFSA